MFLCAWIEAIGNQKENEKKWLWIRQQIAERSTGQTWNRLFVWWCHSTKKFSFCFSICLANVKKPPTNIRRICPNRSICICTNNAKDADRYSFYDGFFFLHVTVQRLSINAHKFSKHHENARSHTHTCSDINVFFPNSIVIRRCVSVFLIVCFLNFLTGFKRINR